MIAKANKFQQEDRQNKIIVQERASSHLHDKKIKENKNNIRKGKQAHRHSILKGLRNNIPDEQ